ncbi:hypothetical protein DDZ14_02820 [Maritimibacter sp. 55A14]|uniref:spermine/spermidine synthase domain-containing protein n=1 Tax=Maritimibacter sp. 55A14 TaxID=2174844 RepID=UPI000D607ADB|nr:hypothetical protein [Maritimibacter sp. 55A14]PWE34105.1 hypothetical protein DDZ14_02820 [Maritimibacter sp. 55A14]
MGRNERAGSKPVFLVPFLAALSGSCGLAYEIILARLFSNYFGDNFLMSGIILSGVFFGVAFGAWQSGRFSWSLAGIEITIGLYAFGMVTAFSYWGFAIVSLGAAPLVNATKLILLLGLPSFLIGTCVPLFSAYARNSAQPDGAVFTRIYGLYNLGAFLSLLVIEFALIRHAGLQVTGYVIAGLNLMIGAGLLWSRAAPPLSRPVEKAAPYVWRLLMALFLASLASGVFQLFVLRLSFSVFGPLNENFAITLASAIAGIALGAWIALRGRIVFQDVLLMISAALLIFLVFVPAFIDVWGRVRDASSSDTFELVAKVVLLGGFPLPVFILFGSLVPLAARAHPGDPVALSGPLLAVSSFGNGAGVLVMYCLLHPYLPLPMIAVVLVGLSASAWLLAVGKRPRLATMLGAACIGATLIFAGVRNWPGVELLLGYRVLASREQLDHGLKTYRSSDTYRAFDQSASVVSFNDGTQALLFNGYRSLTFGPNSKSELHEVTVGATPAMFSGRTGTALVLGLGTGITAGATARIFDHTRVVEINPAIFEIPKHFSSENRGIMTRGSAEIILDDGISMLMQDDHVYDAIVNTVTSPRYYSASKLYTRDFYDIVKTRLADHGVYSGWFDLTIDQDGISIMLNTLEASFEHCRYFVLSSSYFNAVCSDAPLIYRSTTALGDRLAGQGFDEMFRKYGFPDGFGRTMSALEVSFSDGFFARNSAILNTLDLPAIEFVVARQPDKHRTGEILAQTILANIEFQRKSSFGNRQWRANCRTISRMSQLAFKGC